MSQRLIGPQGRPAPCVRTHGGIFLPLVFSAGSLRILRGRSGSGEDVSGFQIRKGAFAVPCPGRFWSVP